MPVFNAADHLAAAMASVLSQTMPEFELLVIDDGSTDESLAIVRSFGDSRIRVRAERHNLGLVARLNEGLAEARAPLVARMDADDLALSGRLARQLAFMRRHPHVGICGSSYVSFNATGDLGEAQLPAGHESIGAKLLFGSPFGHATVMMDRARLARCGLRYDEVARHAEDYDLWERAHPLVAMANIPEVLLRYRVHERQVSSLHGAEQRRHSDSVRARVLARWNVSCTPREFALHCALAATWRPLDGAFAETRDWLRKLARSGGRWSRRAWALRRECAMWERRLTIAEEDTGSVALRG